jgi:hypothetical protein
MRTYPHQATPRAEHLAYIKFDHERSAASWNGDHPDFEKLPFLVLDRLPGIFF